VVHQPQQPEALTRRVWDEIVTPDERARAWGQSEEGRLWDVIWLRVWPSAEVTAGRTASALKSEAATGAARRT
jgi:hypothetical protein